MKAVDLANWILTQQDSDEPDISNLKLQKLLFYIDGCYSAAYKKRVFNDVFEAWKYGPVVREVYDLYSSYGKNPIPTPPVAPALDLPADEIETVKEVLSIFSEHTAWSLRELSHREAPWINAFNRGENTPIDSAEVQAWFTKQYLVVNG